MNNSLSRLGLVNALMVVLTISCNQSYDLNVSQVTESKKKQSCFQVTDCSKPKKSIYAFCYYEPPFDTKILLTPLYTFKFDQPSIASGIDVSEVGTTGNIRILHKGFYKITYMLSIEVDTFSTQNAFVTAGMYLNDGLIKFSTVTTISGPTSIRTNAIGIVARIIGGQCIIKLSKNDILSLKAIESLNASLVQYSKVTPFVLASVIIEAIS